MNRTLPWLLALSACGSSAPQDVPTPAPAPVVADATGMPNVVVVTLDTTRADRLGAYGYTQARTDTMDALAATGRLYTQAYSPLPLTIPSHATLFTGKNPPTHGIRSNGGGLLGPEHLTLAEVLKARGYATAGSVSAFVTTRQWGFAQGFDAYFDTIPQGSENYWHGERPANEVVDDLLGWLEQGHDKPVFLWAHLYDAHFPYVPPEGYTTEDDYRPYDGEIAFVDDQIARLVAAFEGTETLFVLAGDHGESLGDHGELSHGMYAYNATQHIPLILSGAGIGAESVDAVTGLVDVMPTVLDHLGIEVPEGVEGIVQEGHTPGIAYMESWQMAQRFAIAPHVALVDGPYKLMNTPRPELYDLRTDMAELADLSAAKPEVVQALQARLEALQYPPPAAEAGEEAMDPDVAAGLAALGYVDGDMDLSDVASMPDPKDHTKLIGLIQRVERKLAVKAYDEAEATLRVLIETYPKVSEFRTRLASVLVRMERPDEATAVVKAALAIDPDNAHLQSSYASQLASRGQFDEAAALFREVAIKMPYAPRMRALAVSSLRRAGKREEALKLGLDWMPSFHDDRALAGAVGILLVETGRYSDGMTLLQEAMKADVPEMEVAWYLAIHEIGEGNMDEAARLLELELANHPGHLRAAVVLTRVYMRAQRWEDQRKAAELVLAVNPKDAAMWHAKVLALFNLAEYGAARAALVEGLKADPNNPDLILMDANLLAKEGFRDEGAKRFEIAKKALTERQAALAAHKRSLQQELGVPDLKAGETPSANELPAWEQRREAPPH